MGAIGVFPEEQKAYDLVMKLLWILPIVVLGGALVDAIFVAIYMNFAHPWIGILSSEQPKSNSEQKEEVIESSAPKEEEDAGYFISRCSK